MRSGWVKHQRLHLHRQPLWWQHHAVWLVLLSRSWKAWKGPGKNEGSDIQRNPGWASALTWELGLPENHKVPENTPLKRFQVNREKHCADRLKLKCCFYWISINEYYCHITATSFTFQVFHEKKATGALKQDKMVSLSEALWPGYRC